MPPKAPRRARTRPARWRSVRSISTTSRARPTAQSARASSVPRAASRSSPGACRCFASARRARPRICLHVRSPASWPRVPAGHWSSRSARRAATSSSSRLPASSRDSAAARRRSLRRALYSAVQARAWSSGGGSSSGRRRGGTVRIVVLGASGVVGRALLPVLADRFDVLGVSRRRQTRGSTSHGPRRTRRTQSRSDVSCETGTSSSTSFTRWARPISRPSTGARGGQRRGRCRARRGRSSSSAGSAPLTRHSQHLRSRAETAARLASGPVPVTTLRAAIVVGPGSAAFETIRALIDRLPAMVCPRGLDAHSADRARRRRPVPGRRVRTHRGAR